MLITYHNEAKMPYARNELGSVLHRQRQYTHNSPSLFSNEVVAKCAFLSQKYAHLS